MPDIYDAVVVGAGPNGLAAAVELARSGLRVLIVEAHRRVGGGLRTEELTLPGYRHDVCAAVHPMGVASPFFRELELEAHGLEWVHPPIPLAHPLDGDRVAVLDRSVDETAGGLGPDGAAYSSLMGPLVRGWDDLAPLLLGPPRFPRRPVLAARFALAAVRSARGLARSRFDAPEARALFAGMAAHSFLPMDRSPGAAFGLALGAAGHAVGWPVARGGSSSIADALAGLFRELGGEIRTDSPVRALEDLPPARVVLLDLTPRQVLEVAGDRLPTGYRRRLSRYRYGPGAFKVDWALSEPIPWRAEVCARAGTVHLGGTLDEIAASEEAVWRGEVHPRPFVLLAQPSLFDDTRAPDDGHTAWAYCHVPNGFQDDATEAVENQVERFAPGFKDVVRARSVRTPADLEAGNANLVGGDINGGVPVWGQLLLRPARTLDPYATPLPGLYLCSSSTPPGGGVHGMCGFHAARAALRQAFGGPS